ncbi:MAG: Glutamate synthase [NADPH] small chain [Phycisphaerae bacterium]|nr:Glutamate synthase [NADPH] small chain [Phycisphaerae bacterium]
MTNPTGFMEYQRENNPQRPVEQRVHDWKEIELPLAADAMHRQAARCMDCGIPFCHAQGCPVKNRIPEFNDLVHRGRWRDAIENLHSTNNFPEFTGRVCPAPCEAACTLALNSDAVTIKHIEYQIAERAFAEGWVVPCPAPRKTGAAVAVVGSGPAGLAAAQQLARAGHDVTVFEKDDRIGGLLRYGIPDFKLEKRFIDRRMAQMAAEGVVFSPSVAVGKDLSADRLTSRFDAVLLAMGAGEPRRLAVPGGDGHNVLLAMPFLTQQNRVVAGDAVEPADRLSAEGRVVVVIGGGDTGSDCVGTARRQGAREVHQFEILPMPPESRPPETPWPLWPRVLRTSSSHKEGCQRRWSVQTTRLTSGGNGTIDTLHGIEVEWVAGPGGRIQPRELAGTEFSMHVDLVLLAMGFVHVVHAGLVDSLGVELDGRGNVKVSEYQTTRPGVFAAGDTVNGASLVVTAINTGREAAAAVDRFLKSKG